MSLSASISSSKSSCMDSAIAPKTSNAPSVAPLLLFSPLLNYSIPSVIFASNLASASFSAFLNFPHTSLIVCWDLFSTSIVINICFFIEKYVLNALFNCFWYKKAPFLGRLFPFSNYSDTIFLFAEKNLLDEKPFWCVAS